MERRLRRAGTAAGLLAGLLAASAVFARGIDEKRQAVSLNFYDEPKTLDAQRATDTISTMLLGHVLEGLTRLDPGNRPFPAQAESWEVKGKTGYVFKLRKGAVWSDGRQVTAGDFVYSWRRAVDPKTASEYAMILYALKNAQAINQGKMAPDQLGVHAVDDLTLEVTLEHPTEYFPKLLALPTYYPVREDVVAKYGAAYAADGDKMLYNGPYVISAWQHGASLVLTKNDKYWNKAEIALNEIAMPELVRDKEAEFQRFKDGRFAMTWSLTKELLPAASAAGLHIRKYNYGTVWYFQFNTKRSLTGNKAFRKAFQLALNRGEYVQKVQGIPGTKPSYGLIPEYMPGVNKRYGEEFPLSFPDAQLTEAKALLKQAKKELGLKELPKLTVLASDTDDVRRDMAYFQHYFKEALGLELTLDFQPFKARLERTDKRDFDIVNSGWGPDYLDAMTYADLLTSWNRNNATGWSSAEYDAKIRQAVDSTDPKERLGLMSAAERILVDEAPVVPYFQQFRVYVQDPRLIGVLRRTVGADPDFYYAKLAPAVAAKH